MTLRQRAERKSKKCLFWRMVARRTPVGAHNIFVLASLAKTSCWDWVGLQVLWPDFLTFFFWIDMCVCGALLAKVTWQAKTKVGRLLPFRALQRQLGVVSKYIALIKGVSATKQKGNQRAPKLVELTRQYLNCPNRFSFLYAHKFPFSI